MELDHQSLFGLHVTWCAQLFSDTPQLPPPTHLGSYTRGAIGQLRQTTSPCNPLDNMFMSSVLFSCQCAIISPFYGSISVAFRCRAGVDVNIVNLQGRSPLRIALLEGNLDLAGLLLDNGANIDYLDNDSRLGKETLLFLVKSSEFSCFYGLSADLEHMIIWIPVFNFKQDSLFETCLYG